MCQCYMHVKISATDLFSYMQKLGHSIEQCSLEIFLLEAMLAFHVFHLMYSHC